MEKSWLKAFGGCAWCGVSASWRLRKRILWTPSVSPDAPVFQLVPFMEVPILVYRRLEVLQLCGVISLSFCFRKWIEDYYKSWNTLKNSLNNQCFHRKSLIALWGRIKIRSKVANFRINFFHWYVPMVQIFENIWRRIRRSEKRVGKDEKAVKSLRFNKLTILCQIAKSGKNG